MATNSDNFDLRNWRLTLPVDSSGGIGGTAVEIPSLIGYENSRYFYDAPDGAMVFVAHVEGATTSGSKYARSELREMKGSERAAWKLSEGGTMTATLEVDKVQTKSDGSQGKIVIGQIHGKNDELVRLYYEKGTVYFVNDQAGSDNKETKFLLKNAKGQTPDISLNEKFSYKIDARGDTLTVEVHADGQVYSSVTRINPVWQSDTFYFKAGVYLGVNETQGTGVGQTSFYGLDFGHKAGTGLGGLTVGPAPAPEPAPDPVPAPKPEPEPAFNVITGTKNTETLNGTSGADRIDAGSGDDKVWGGGGADLMTGGTGNNTYIYKAVSEGGDTVTDFNSGDKLDLSALFKSVVGFKAAEAQAKGYVVIAQKGSSVTVSADLDGAAGAGAPVLLATLAGATLDAFNSKTLILADGPAAPASSAPAPQPEPTPQPTPAPAPAPTPSPSLIGDDAANSILGTSSSDTIRGNGGNDVLRGAGGNDAVYGDAGNDTVYGDAGDDSLRGGIGDDILHAGDGNDIASSDSGYDRVYGGNGDDLLRGGDDNDTMWGDAGNDRIYGDYDDDTLHGGDGSDSLWGGVGDDFLHGNAGNDTLCGDGGDDILAGGAGLDTLTGGAGADVFAFTKDSAFTAVDIITDFARGQDALDLSGLLDLYDPAKHAITDFVRITNSGASSVLAVDTDGGGNSFVAIAELRNVTGLTDEESLVASGGIII